MGVKSLFFLRFIRRCKVLITRRFHPVFPLKIQRATSARPRDAPRGPGASEKGTRPTQKAYFQGFAQRLPLLSADLLTSSQWGERCKPTQRQRVNARKRAAAIYLSITQMD